MNNTTQNPASANPPRFFTLRLRLPVLIISILLLLLGIIWIFIVGVIVGRGFNTQEKIGALANIIPSPPIAEATGAVGLPESRAEPVITEETGKSGEADLDVLFKDNLKTPYIQAPVAGATGAQQARANPGAGASPAGTATGAARTIPPAAVQASGATYEYIFQVSSLNQLAQAEALAQKLKAGGLSSQVETFKSGQNTRYRVIVTFKGRAVELDAFKDRLKQFNISQPFLRNRKVL
jgi:cell division septation protein DedD